MKRGLIPDTILRLKKTNVFTPNVHHEWQREENERSLIEWARNPLPYDLPTDPQEPSHFWRGFKESVRGIIP